MGAGRPPVLGYALPRLLLEHTAVQKTRTCAHALVRMDGGKLQPCEWRVVDSSLQRASHPTQRLQVMEAAGKHQVLIFVHSRKETAKTGR